MYDYLVSSKNIFLVLLIVSIGVNFLIEYFRNTFLQVLNRWFQWVIISATLALFFNDYEIIEKPFWLLFLTFFLIWFLIESLYIWIFVKVMNKSDFPLFPNFYINEKGEQWPVDTYFFGVRAWIKLNGFKFLQALKANYPGEIEVKYNIFQDFDNKVRLSVLIIMTKNRPIVLYAFSSITASGSRIITDNYNIPFAGVYPDNWIIARKNNIFNIQKLYCYHQKNLKNINDVLVKWDNDPMVDIQEQQIILEKFNITSGYFLQKKYSQEYGKFTAEGCYCLWKQIWILRYFGYYLMN